MSAAQQDLIVRVVQAYFGAPRARQSAGIPSPGARFERQLEQTRQRFEVGLIAITDVYEAEAARDLAQVNRIVDENNVAVAKENLSVLTGQTPGALFVLGEQFDPRPPKEIALSGSTLPCRTTTALPQLDLQKRPPGRTPPLREWATRQP